MELGNIAFNVPPSMSLEKAETVILLLSPTHAVEELERRLRDEGAVGDVKDARIKIHERMRADLSGDGFHITRVTEDTLPVSRQEPTQWKWDVRAERAGTLKLNVVLNAIVDLDDGTGPRPYPIRTFSKTYLVEVPRQEGALVTFLQNNWPWLFATLLIPAGAWAWHRRRRKRPAFAAGGGARIFISYRREDAAGHAGRLRDALVAHFGNEHVFMDIESIGYGDDFVEAIERAVGLSAVVVVVIGRQWLSVTDKTGARRLDSPRDFVHQEIAAALRHEVRIIPVLVEGAPMPAEDVLPEPLSRLARRNAVELSDTRWKSDVQRLVGALEAELSRKESAP